jgi:rhodanese-related sulfurtransferase
MTHANTFVKLVEDALKHVPEISPDEVMALLSSPRRGEEFILIDVREDREWQAGHIAGAIHIGKGVIERDIESRVPDHGVKVVLYCGGGYRSVLAAESLQKMGYTNVASMAGGWRDWCANGFPIEK